uniref:Uncharacterized protein n=1 Tax=Avena sativa TaxID=4498 RepID=A0ACD5Y231_AVESA
MDPPPPFPPAASPIAQTAPSMATTAARRPPRRRSVRSRFGGKRRRIAADETSVWASLPDDIVRLVADRVLIAGDVVDYINLRATCSDWRASTDSPLLGGHQHLRPRGWAALCDGDAARPDDVHEVAFFKPATGRRLRLRLPELRGHRIVAFSAGLLVLLHKRYTTVRVLHPFTRAILLDLPSLAPAFRLVGGTRDSLLRMNAAVFTSPAAATATAAAIDAVVAWFPGTPAVLFAKPGDTGWDAVLLDIELQSVLAFRGRLYATTKASTNILQVYPPTYNNTFPVDTPIPDALGDPSSCIYFLVQSHGRMLLAVRHYASTPTVHTAFKVFEVDLERRRLEPVRGIGGRALVLGTDRCLSVSARDLPSISGNSVYCSSQYGVECFSLGGGPAGLEWFAALRSVRPFTIVDHLITYCNHLQWARGLMFHEYQDIPDCLEELKRKIRKQDSQLHIPIRETKKKTGKPSAAQT